MSIGTMRELFVHELSDAMSAEQQILKLLPEIQKEALNGELKQALKEHEQETKGQIQNLQDIFKQLGEKPEETTCFGVKGLAEERQALLEEEPSPEMLEMANVSALEKTERLRAPCRWVQHLCLSTLHPVAALEHRACAHSGFQPSRHSSPITPSPSVRTDPIRSELTASDITSWQGSCVCKH